MSREDSSEDKATSGFRHRGHEVFTRQQMPFSDLNFDKLNSLVFGDISKFSMILSGDTKEKTAVLVHRLLVDGNPPIPADPQLMDEVLEIIGNREMLEFFQKILDIPSLMIRRAQAHIIVRGGFISRHIDSDSSDQYVAAVILMLSAAEKGGEFVVFNDSDGIQTYGEFGMIVTDADLPHEVTDVEAGERRTLAFWLADGRSTV